MLITDSILTRGSRKLTKRLEELTQESAALKPQLIPQLDALVKKVPELVDFGITVSALRTCLRSYLHSICTACTFRPSISERRTKRQGVARDKDFTQLCEAERDSPESGQQGRLPLGYCR